jgi:DNA-binding PadR family transcriptional regulator
MCNAYYYETRGPRMHRRHGYRAMWGPPTRGPGPGGPRARRGDVRAAALVLLDEEPRNGYQLMQEIEQRSEGHWRPSPGAVYPALAQLEDEGLIRVTEADGKKRFELTDEGKAHVEEHRDQLGTPWDTLRRDVPAGIADVRHVLPQLALAVEQVMRGGTEEQIAKAKEILDDARKAIYRLLAD